VARITTCSVPRCRYRVRRRRCDCPGTCRISETAAVSSYGNRPGSSSPRARHVGIQPRRLARMLADAGADANVNVEFCCQWRSCYHLSFHPNLLGDAPRGSRLVLCSRVSADLGVTYASSNSQWMDFCPKVLLKPVPSRYTGNFGVCGFP
jgi:hypothetical protein